MSKEKLIPALRFPEFEKDSCWVETELNDHCHNISSGKDKNQDNSEFDLYGSTGIIGSTKNGSYEGDYILVARVGANAGLLNRATGQFGVTDNTLVVNLKNPEMVDFIFYSLDKIGLNKLVFGSGQPLVTGKQLKELNIPTPINPQEQQKIASCLSSLDELLAAHNDKLDALKDHKKGLLQNLFPQDGETVPKVRFPEFEGDGEWVEKKLGDVEVSAFVNDKIDSEKLTLKNYISTDNMLPDYSGVAEASKLPTTNRVTEFLKGDILISNIRPYLKKVWKSDRNGGASNDVLIFRSGSSVVSDFLEFILKNDAFINYVMQSAKGVKMPRGDKDSMLKYPTRIPKKEEQQKIASCLSAVDELITAQQEKIEQLQQHKKGLMQGLFPNVVCIGCKYE